MCSYTNQLELPYNDQSERKILTNLNCMTQISQNYMNLETSFAKKWINWEHGQELYKWQPPQ